MNWARVYNQLMIRAIPRGLNKRNLGYYLERHHVIPKSMGGSDSAEALKKMSESKVGVYCGEKNSMYGTRPWDTGSAKHSEAAQTVWGNAERAYQLFLTGCGHKKIFKELNIAGTNPSSFISVVKKFREGWIPMEDEEWVDRFQGWTFEVNPFKDIS